MEWKNNDIVRWQYTDEKLKRVNDGNNGGTTYWCVSRIAIFDSATKLFRDTYWGGSSSGNCFTFDTIGVDIEVVFVANMEGLTLCNESDFNKYDDADCVNLSHPNMTRGGRYIRKGAIKSVIKIRKAIEAHIAYYQREADYALRQVERLKESLETVTSETCPPCHADVFVC